MKDILVIYYSLFGTTELAAEYLAEKTNADLVKIIPEREYSFNYNTAVKEARNDIEKGFCPKLVNSNPDVSSYKLIFLGGPNWFKRLPPPIVSFMKMNEQKITKVIPFCTHGGGGIGLMKEQITEKCKIAIVEGALAIHPDTITEDIDLWLQINIGLITF
jgi:flavodoxin